MRQALMVAPHFPPDTGAATHRVRLLAPHLPEFGWSPTVVSVDPRDYEGRLDRDLLAMVPETLRVERVRAWSVGWTRKLGFGDLGLRALGALYRTCSRLLRENRYDVFFVTIFPTYPALLGPVMKRRFAVPFVLDYIDPWVGSWGLTTGAGAGGTVDAKSRLSRSLAVMLEPLVVRAADGLSAVSEETFRAVMDRVPQSRTTPCCELPYGAESADFDYLRSHPRDNACFERRGDEYHLVYAGTVLPLGLETLRAFLAAVGGLKSSRPALYERLRVHFIGTSNQTTHGVKPVVMPEAERLGVEDVVHEIPERVDYLDALTALVAADAILMMGSSEPHYTASKLYPALLAKRPLFAIYHAKSSVVGFVHRVVRPPTSHVVTYGDPEGARASTAEIVQVLERLMTDGRYEPSAVDERALEGLSARAMAKRLSGLFEEVRSRSG